MTAENEALIIIDVQNDFCPGGALAVAKGDEIIDGINTLMAQYTNIILTQDWHPAGHASFASSHENAEPLSVMRFPYGPQVLWPDHCVQGSEGARFHRALNRNRAHVILRKGFLTEIDSYSAFFENDRTTPTGLEGYLRNRGITHIWLVGLATDFCVYYSAIDGVRQGFSVTVDTSLCRAIDIDGSLDAAIKDMASAGVTII